jgi:hypothetical protein
MIVPYYPNRQHPELGQTTIQDGYLSCLEYNNDLTGAEQPQQIGFALQLRGMVSPPEERPLTF